MATSAEEDFSFPITATDSPPQFIESPPLWRPTSSTTAASPGGKPESSKGKEVQDEEELLTLCSFQEVKASSIDKRMSSSCNDEDDEDEDKMDILWQDLNDEFSRIGCGKTGQIHSDVSSPGKEVKISCVKGLKLLKANRNMFDGKKPSILVFIKVLKKVFLMQNSHRTIKKHSW